jgi:hypothetical protein
MADETPPRALSPVPATVARTPPVAIWSLILALLSFTCGWLFTAIPAVICIASDDGKLRITVPGTWTKLPELNKFATANLSSGGRATLQVGDKSRQMYLIVITDTKTDVPDLTLEKHHDMTRDRMFQKMKNTSATDPVPLTIDGHPAMQDELTGTENGANVVFLHTTVDDGDHFQQILAWTLKSRWQKQNQLLRKVTVSFRSEK